MPDETVWGQDLLYVETWLLNTFLKRLGAYNIMGPSQKAGHLQFPDQNLLHHQHEDRHREASFTAQ